MKVLVIGGTRFIGWHIVAECLNRGHRVTLLNRGRTDPTQWPDLTRISADRRAPRSRVAAYLVEDWDLVIDCCAYELADLELIHALRDRTRHYTLISSAAVHGPKSGQGKRDCEREAAIILARTPLLTPRLGLTIGPRDPTGRLAYWLARARRGGPALVPMQPNQPLRLIDVRDVAAFVLDAATDGRGGAPDVIGPRTTSGALLRLVAQLTGRRVRWRWVPEDVALGCGLRPWTQIPLWIPATDIEARRLMSRTPTGAAGPRCRPLASTLRDLLSAPPSLGTALGLLDQRTEHELVDRLTG